MILRGLSIAMTIDDSKLLAKKLPKKTTNADEKPDQKLKVYILSMTCALTRHTTLEVCEDRSYESTKLAIQRIFYERGTSRILISNQSPSFKAVKKDLSDQEAMATLKWLQGWKASDAIEDLELTYETEFRFQNPESSEMMGLIERMNRIISHSMLSLKQETLRITQVTTLVKGMQFMLNKRPLCGMNKENTEEVEFVTPNMLLTGDDLSTCPNYDLPKCNPRLIQRRSDIINYSNHMKASLGQVYTDVCRRDERVQEIESNSERDQGKRLRNLLGNEQRDEPRKYLPDLQGNSSDTRKRRRQSNQIIEGIIDKRREDQRNQQET